MSGVTIGRGYDMGSRSKVVVYQDMLKAGIADGVAKCLSEGAGLKGEQAREFVIKNKSSIGKITHCQQVKLFNNIYPGYEDKAKKNYNKWTNGEKSRVEWDDLHQAIRDILVDFVYQGFTKGPKPMRAGMTNDFNSLIKYIEETPSLKQYEAGRNRVKYLKKRKSEKVVNRLLGSFGVVAILVISFIGYPVFAAQANEKAQAHVASSQVDDCAAKKREASDRKLSEVFSEFKDRTNRLYRADQTLGSALIDLVNKNQDAWSLYRDLTCKMEAFEIEENSPAYVTTVNNCVIHMNDERVVFLKNK